MPPADVPGFLAGFLRKHARDSSAGNPAASRLAPARVEKSRAQPDLRGCAAIDRSVQDTEETLARNAAFQNSSELLWPRPQPLRIALVHHGAPPASPTIEPPANR